MLIFYLFYFPQIITELLFDKETSLLIYCENLKEESFKKKYYCFLLNIFRLNIKILILKTLDQAVPTIHI